MSLMERLEKQKETLESLPHLTKNINNKKMIYQDLQNKIQDRLIDTANLNKIDPKEINSRIISILEEIIEEEDLFLLSKDKEEILNKTIDEIVGYGPITPLIHDSSITEIMVNGPNKVYIERNGKIEKTNISFRDKYQILHVIEKIVSPLGRRIDESSPMVDARLPNGSRVNAVIAPLSIDSPILTIRKFSEETYTVQDLINFGTLTPNIANFLKCCIEARLNIVITGGTGSGKTTTLNALSSYIPYDERIVTIEDAAELKLLQEHVVRMETKPQNIEGKGQITVRDLVRNSLRMRPDRIIVGEVRGGEALDMLQAMNTGHDGSLTTGHANSPRDMLSRVETMVLMAGMDLPLRAIREQISSAIDLIIYQARLKDGSRRVTNITEVQGMEGDIITLQDIFKFEYMGKDKKGKIIGDLLYTGIKPKILKKIHDAGVRYLDEWFIEY